MESLTRRSRPGQESNAWPRTETERQGQSVTRNESAVKSDRAVLQMWRVKVQYSTSVVSAVIEISPSATSINLSSTEFELYKVENGNRWGDPS